MRQRLAIAMALLNNPDLLVFDEPLNGLDPKGVREIRSIIKELAHEKNVTIIISSHILSEMELVCDRFCIVNNGALAEVKEVKDIDNSEHECNIWEFTFVNECNISKLEKLIQYFGFDVISLESHRMIININNEKKTTFIKKLVKEDLNIYSIIPVRESLEEYFLNKVGEKIEAVS